MTLAERRNRKQFSEGIAGHGKEGSLVTGDS
jgi:hypothetical protein